MVYIYIKGLPKRYLKGDEEMDKQNQKDLLNEIQGNLSLEDFSKLINRSKVEVYRIRNGKRGISKKLAKRLSEISGKPLEECLI